MKKSYKVFAAIVITLTLVVVVVILCSKYNVRILIGSADNPSVFQMNLIQNAIFYDAKPQRFEEIVRANKSWVNLIAINADGSHRPSVLALCARKGDKEKMEILLKYGADPESAIEWLEEHNEDNAARLVSEIANRTL